MIDERKEDCPCKRIQCERHGDCKRCLEHHEINKRYLPACKRKSGRKNKKAQDETVENSKYSIK